MSSSHVACLLALSGAAHGLKLGDFKSDFDVMKDQLRGKESVARIY